MKLGILLKKELSFSFESTIYFSPEKNSGNFTILIITQLFNSMELKIKLKLNKCEYVTLSEPKIEA